MICLCGILFCFCSYLILIVVASSRNSSNTFQTSKIDRAILWKPAYTPSLPDLHSVPVTALAFYTIRAYGTSDKKVLSIWLLTHITAVKHTPGHTSGQCLDSALYLHHFILCTYLLNLVETGNWANDCRCMYGQEKGKRASGNFPIILPTSILESIQ